MPERRQPGAPGLRPPPGRPREQELGPEHLRRHHPGYLRVREWEELDEGESFTEEDVHEVCDGLPARPDGRARAVRRAVAGRPGGLRQRRAAAGRRRPQPQGGRHHRRGPGRPARRTLDDGQIPRELPGGRTPADGRAITTPSESTSAPALAPLPARTLGSVSDPLADAVARHAPAGTPLERRLDPRPGLVDRGDPGRDGPDHPRAPRAPPDRARASLPISPSATSPRSSMPSREPWRSSPACSSASP